MIKGTSQRTPHGGFKVFIDDKLLNPAPSQAVRNHSPDGFGWGYSGSGPAQLALALLLHFTEDTEYAAANYQQFKFDVVSKLPTPNFEIENSIVRDWVAEHGEI